MRLKEYLANRWILLVGSFLIFLIAYLTLALSVNLSLIKNDIRYLLLLIPSLFLLVVCLDYYREQKRMKQWDALIDNNELLLEDAVANRLTDSYGRLLKNIYQNYWTLIQDTNLKKEEYQDFITSWVHDSKIPISILRMTIENDTIKNQDTRQSVEEELYRLEEYINKIMYFIKIDDFSNDYIPEEVSLQKIVNSSLKNFGKVFSYKQIKLNQQPLKQTVLTDPKWAAFIVSQIISNAIKYTDKKGSIMIWSEETPTHILLNIKNTGIGIPKGDLTRIFQKGFTGFTGRQERKSTGYGLYLSKKLASQLNHTLEATSVYQESATFTLGFQKRNDYYIK